MNRSASLYTQACDVMPAGVNSPVRAFYAVNGTPTFFVSGQGCRVQTEDRAELVDFCMSWGPLILGHGHPDVIDSVIETVKSGLTFGACHVGEMDLCKRILDGFPWADQVRLVNSGTEAVMSAIRLARGATGRNAIVKFTGGYHGHVDSLLVKAGSGLVTQGIASSAGVTERMAADTLVVPFDDIDAVRELFEAHPDQIAAIVMEPMPANNGLLLQRPEYLKALRALCDEHGTLLIFDEVISGFRLHYGGYGALVDVQPDLVSLGKIIGGGMPIGGLLGPKHLMEQFAPMGPVYQAGTLSGNPVSAAAGSATLGALEDGSVYAHLESLGQHLEDRLADAPGVRVVRKGSIVWLYLSDNPAPRTAEDVDAHIKDRFADMHGDLLKAGFYLPPSAFEVLFLSAAHTPQDLNDMADAFVASMRERASVPE
jgi:glutamate-1-semialdehyde 2,1-aminomutase